MKQYLDLMQKVLSEGTYKSDRTGTGTYSIFGHQMRFDLSEGFPLVTTKKVHMKSVIHELLWFLKGDTNVHYLQEHGVRIWDEWADENGDLGPIYGAQWRSWKSFDDDGHHMMHDQIATVIQQLKTNPDSRRIVVSAWNVGELDDMALPPCHVLFQFYSAEMNPHERIRALDCLTGSNVAWDQVVNTRSVPGFGDTEYEYWCRSANAALDDLKVPRRILSCQLYQRSADIFLGVPFNIASYALLTMMIAQVTGHALGEFIWTGGDCHLYSNHIEQAKLQLIRKPLPLPRMTINSSVMDIDQFKYEDFELVGYDSHPHIKAEVAV